MQREVLVAQERELGADHPNTLLTAGNLARTLSDQGTHAEAEKMQREVLAAQERVLGAEHPSMLWSAGNLVHILRAQGKRAEADEMERSARCCRRSRGC